MSVDLQKIFQRNKNHPWQSIGNNTIILSTKGMMSHELEDVGSFIWQSLDGETSLEDIEKKLCENYEVDPQQAQEDLAEFMNHLITEDLVTSV